MNRRFATKMLATTAVVIAVSWLCGAQDQPLKLTVHWDKVISTSQTTPTLQVVVNPPLQRGTPVHDNAFRALQDLGADYAGAFVAGMDGRLVRAADLIRIDAKGKILPVGGSERADEHDSEAYTALHVWKDARGMPAQVLS